jgi:hypothetical protein
MPVIQIDPADRRQAAAFLQLPFKLYRDLPQWVPPLKFEARRMLDTRKNPFFGHSQAAFLLARSPTGEVQGRLAVLDNRRYNEYNQERTAFFYLFECVDDDELARGLFDAGFAWARARGLNAMVGPKGFTALDGMGLLVDGFEHRPAFGLPYNPAYYPELIEAAGFEPHADVVSGYLDSHLEFPERIHQIARRVRERRGLHIARYRSRRDLRKLTPKLKAMYNSALGGTSGNVPLTDEEAGAIADQMLWFADPRLIKVVMKDDEPVGFLFAYPDVSEALQATGGRLLPFGWLRLLLELRRTRWVNVNGAGMIEGYRGLGGTAILFSEMYKSVREGGFEHADLVQIGLENSNMQRELRNLGVDFYKTHRIYRREL